MLCYTYPATNHIENGKYSSISANVLLNETEINKQLPRDERKYGMPRLVHANDGKKDTNHFHIFYIFHIVLGRGSDSDRKKNWNKLQPERTHAILLYELASNRIECVCGTNVKQYNKWLLLWHKVVLFDNMLFFFCAHRNLWIVAVSIQHYNISLLKSIEAHNIQQKKEKKRTRGPSVNSIIFAILSGVPFESCNNIISLALKLVNKATFLRCTARFVTFRSFIFFILLVRSILSVLNTSARKHFYICNQISSLATQKSRHLHSTHSQRYKLITPNMFGLFFFSSSFFPFTFSVMFDIISLSI